MARPKFPIDTKMLTKASQIFENDFESDATIEVLVDASASSELVAFCRKALNVRSNDVELTVSRFDADMPALNKETSFIIVIAGTSPYLRRMMEISLWSDMSSVYLSEDAATLVSTVSQEDALDIAKTIIEVDVTQSQAVFEKQLAKWCVAHLPDLRLSLGSAFPFMRNAAALDLTRQTSLENAVVAAVFFLPGADLPVLTLNQCKLLYKIAVINKVPISRERLVDAALVVGSAFGLRSLSRLAVRKLGPVGWLARAAIAFGSTMAMGHAANELYRRGGGVMELVGDKLKSDAVSEGAASQDDALHNHASQGGSVPQNGSEY